MVRSWVLVAIACLAPSLGCAARSIPPDPGPAGEPRASWIVRMGPSDGRTRVVCRSNVSTPCAIQMTTDTREMSVGVSVYLYAAGEKTTYKGWFSTSFVSDDGHEFLVDYQIEPAAQPTALAVYGPVVSAPGTYEFRMALAAEVPGRADPYKFEFAVPVQVTAPAP